MGFLKRLLSIGRARDKKAGREQRPARPVSDDNRQRGQQSAALLQPPPSQPQHPETMPSVSEDDTEIAVSRLLRSASAHFKVMSETNYDVLPPIPHPINSISSRNTGAGMSSNSGSMRHKGSYKVKVHPRQQLSKTEFPNAYPPQTPRVPAMKSTPNLQETTGAPSRRRQISAGQSDPRKVPFTPRDVNRLSRLRQDPSVASLLNMYDDKGQLKDSAFSNTPRAAPSALDSNRRESTFKELLRESEVSDADLSWAERCVAESNASTSTLSTAPSAHTPNTLNFGEVRAVEGQTTFLSDTTETYEAISSMVVELSMTTDRSLHSFPSSTTTSVMLEPEPKVAFERKPSLRASQVFNFINERRARRKSEGIEALLNTGTLSNGQSVPLIERSREAQTWSRKSSPYGTPDSLENQFQSVEQLISPLPASQLSALALPAPAPDSPMPFRPLYPAPRTRASSTGAADALRASDMLKARPSRRRVGGSAGGDDTLFITRDELLQRQSEIEREWRMAPQSTPHVRGPRTNRNRKTSATTSHTKQMTTTDHERAPLTVKTNDHSRATRHDQHGDAPKGSKYSRSKSVREISGEKRFSVRTSQYETFVANLEARKHDKENEGGRTRAGHTDLNRAATTAQSAQSKALPALPLTPTRSRSLAEPASPVSSSELSPEAAQLMADLRSRKARARPIQRVNDNLRRVR